MKDDDDYINSECEESEDQIKKSNPFYWYFFRHSWKWADQGFHDIRSEYYR